MSLNPKGLKELVGQTKRSNTGQLGNQFPEAVDELHTLQ